MDTKWRVGKVCIDGLTFDVTYRFINEDTIEYLGFHGKRYYTHYKSLVVEV